MAPGLRKWSFRLWSSEEDFRHSFIDVNEVQDRLEIGIPREYLELGSKLCFIHFVL